MQAQGPRGPLCWAVELKITGTSARIADGGGADGGEFVAGDPCRRRRVNEIAEFSVADVNVYFTMFGAARAPRIPEYPSRVATPARARQQRPPTASPAAPPKILIELDLIFYLGAR